MITERHYVVEKLLKNIKNIQEIYVYNKKGVDRFIILLNTGWEIYDVDDMKDIYWDVVREYPDYDFIYEYPLSVYVFDKDALPKSVVKLYENKDA